MTQLSTSFGSAAKLFAPYSIGREIACLGDSITAGKYPQYVRSYQIRNAYDRGVVGNTTAQMLARLSADVLAYTPKYCVVLGGINDVQADASASSIQANLISIINQLLGANIVPVVLQMSPWSGYVNFTNPRESVRVAVNTWIAGLGYSTLNLDSLLGDGGNPPALQVSYDSGDHLHPSTAGQKVMAQSVLGLLS